MNVQIREYGKQDRDTVMHIWNQVVSDGVAFPQEDALTETDADLFFSQQSYTGVAANIHAIHLYERLGFVRLGTVEGGFRMPDGSYEDIILFYHTV